MSHPSVPVSRRYAIPGNLAQRAMASDWPFTAATVVGLLGLWQLSVTAGLAPSYISSPSEIATAFVHDWPILWPAALTTMSRLVPGFAIGAGLGVLLGLLAGVFRPADFLFGSFVSATYSLPKIALFPVIAVWFGYSDQSRILLVAIACFYPAFVNAYGATRGIDKQLMRVAANAGARRWRTFWAVVVPATVPRVLVGLRVSLAISYAVLFAAETLGGTLTGLGPRIMLVLQGGPFPEMYAAVVCYGLFGIATDRLLLWIGRRLTYGQELTLAGDH
jgi:ABC-type nitrate/sulfonate/bicarbonate transport system permease component